MPAYKDETRNNWYFSLLLIPSRTVSNSTLTIAPSFSMTFATVGPHCSL